MGFIKEFREFALKGNVLDMAVGVVIGGAFGLIVKSLIDDVIMPLIAIPGKADFSNMYMPLTAEVSKAVELNPNLSLAEARPIGPVLAYGNFITVAINFVILAFCVFLVVKVFNMARKRFEAAPPPAAPKAPPEDVVLLREIRDALKAR